MVVLWLYIVGGEMLKKFLPLGIFLLILVFLFRGLQLNPREVPSAQLGHSLPSMSLQLWGEKQKKTNFAQWQGQPIILHFWASWCDSCQQDVLELLKLKNLSFPRLIGVNYKDHTKDLKRWLLVNPSIFDDLIIDKSGRLGLELGVVATPETFIVDKQGVIRFRYQGPLTREVIEKQIMPQIQVLNS